MLTNSVIHHHFKSLLSKLQFVQDCTIWFGNVSHRLKEDKTECQTLFN